MFRIERNAYHVIQKLDIEKLKGITSLEEISNGKFRNFILQKSMIYKNVKTPTKKLVIQCDCEGMEFLQFLVFEREPWEENGEHETDEMYIQLAGTNISGMWDKIKAAWTIIRYGEFENYGVISDRKQLEELQGYLGQVLKYWNENYMKELDKKLDKLVEDKK